MNFSINEKLNILASSAKYDVSCSSSGSNRSNKNGVGNANISGICHSWSSDGRCVSLLKVLFSNNCIYDCAYCVNRKSNPIVRTSFDEKELINLTINFYKRNYIEGLFLSSAVFKSPDYTMEKIINVVKTLREKENFNGYIHIKAIPGADQNLIRIAGFYADRMSVNIELPSEKSLKLLAPEKDKKDILKPMKFIGESLLEIYDSKKKSYKNIPKFVPAGQSTQLIIGASSDSDYSIIKLSENLYNKFNLKRVYFSAYTPVVEDERLPILKSPPLKRENRLYQADWLLRFYGFKANEILDENNNNLDLNLDPKTNWAINNFKYFPVEINKIDYKFLIRVPGIGIKSALKIVAARKYSNLDFFMLKKIGVVLKRAKYFITCNGKYYDVFLKDPYSIKINMLTEKDKNYMKLPLFKKDPFSIEVRN